MTRLEGDEQIIGGDDLAIRAARAVAGSVLLLCLSVGLLSAAPTLFLWSGAPSLSTVDFAAFLDVVNARRPYANASEWRVGKIAHAIHANSGGQIQEFLSAYVCSEAGDCASDLGCGALRAMCSVRVPWDGASSDDDVADADRRGAVNTGSSTAGLHFVDAPRLNDLNYPNATSPKSVDFWVRYFEKQHTSDFDVWMHSKIQLFASNLSAFVGPLADLPTFERVSVDPDGVRVAHVGVAVAGRVVEFVGPASSLGESWTAPAWAEAECPAAHALVSSLAELEDAGGAAVDDATAFKGSQGLARRVAWPSMPHFSAIRVDDAAPAGEYAVADLEGAIQADHDAFLTGRRGSWDRWLDQHLGLWYAGGEEKCDALISDLHADLEAAGVPFAERQQADALLIYAGFGYGAGALAVEYQFADCTADAPSECACDASNNDGLFEATTGDTCWALGDDWCA
ncbi:hypothetical protein JL720_4272 [Aureococcus anophagefferens]|nr:hypothetical protein JL720_4272 [Aureococcus anophagefferens]